MKTQSKRSWIAVLLSVILVQTGMFAGVAQAAMVSTQMVIQEQQIQHDRESLRLALDQDGVREQLVSMGVNPEVVEERIASLTPTELAELNERVQEMPAGEGVLGALVTIFIVLVITDMLCATNIFSFVRCINK